MDISHLSDDEVLAELDRLFALPSKNTPRVRAMLDRALDHLEKCAQPRASSLFRSITT